MSAVLWLFAILTSSCNAWFNSSCGSQCFCQVQGGLSCFIGFNSTMPPEAVLCSEARKNTQDLKVECKKLRTCDPVSVRRILDFFLWLKVLSLHKCYIELSDFAVSKQSSTITWKLDLQRQRSNDSSFGFFFNITAKLAYYSSSLPSCSLFRLIIQRSQLFTFPLGFINKCHQLTYLAMNHNDLTVLDLLDFVTIITRTRLICLDLRNNYLVYIAPDFIIKAMERVKWLLADLSSWIKTNSLNQTENQGFIKLAKYFIGWSNKTSSLNFEDLVQYMEASGINIDFIVNRSPLKFLHLLYNRLEEVPKALIGFNQVIVLDLNFNKLRNCFEPFRRRIFYAFRKSLQTIDVSHNEMTQLTENALIYLKHARIINLAYNNLFHMAPNAVPNNSRVRILYLKNNSLAYLEFKAVLKHLILLDVSENKLFTLTSSLSRHIPNIKELYLDSNPMTTIAPFALHSLKSLAKIYIRNGFLTEIPASNFKTNLRATRADKLHVLLQNNKKPFLCDCFSVFPYLKRERHRLTHFNYPQIYWSNNTNCTTSQPKIGKRLKFLKRKFKCSFIEQYCMSSNETRSQQKCLYCPKKCHCYFYDSQRCKSIRLIIDCSMKKYKYVPEISVSKFALVSELRLQYNLIRMIQVNAFGPNLRHLESLHLSNNKLETIRSYVFKHLTSLLFLDLSNNWIHSIEVGTFQVIGRIDAILMRNVALRSLDAALFDGIANLSYVSLSIVKSFKCNCDQLLSFFAFQTKSIAHIYFRANCSWQPGEKSLEVTRAAQVCAEQRVIQEKARRQLLWYISMGVVTTCVVLLTCVCVCCLSRHRFRLRGFLDRTVLWSCGRRLLCLSSHNISCDIDVAFLVHERQTEQYRDIRHRVEKSIRRDLVLIHMADCVPGAIQLSCLPDFIEKVAVFVVLLSTDLLEDGVTRQALTILLSATFGLKRAPQTVSVVLDRHVLVHELWPNFKTLLQGRRLLEWQENLFWVQFFALLPAPRVLEGAQDRQQLINLSLEMSQAPCLAHLCIIADQEQTDGPVRRLFNRYRGALQLCYLSRNSLYGVEPCSVAGKSLEEIFAMCQQILLVVTSELLQDPWSEFYLIPALLDSLKAPHFRGRVILVEACTASQLHCSKLFEAYHRLRKERAVVTLTWAALEINWDLLNDLLLTQPIEMTMMDEVEFSNILCSPAVRVN